MDDITVQLPPGLRQELERRIEQTDFESLDEYVRFVLQEIADGSDVSETRDDGVGGQQLEDRLESLGYL